MKPVDVRLVGKFWPLLANTGKCYFVCLKVLGTRVYVANREIANSGPSRRYGGAQ